VHKSEQGYTGRIFLTLEESVNLTRRKIYRKKKLFNNDNYIMEKLNQIKNL